MGEAPACDMHVTSGTQECHPVDSKRMSPICHLAEKLSAVAQRVRVATHCWGGCLYASATEGIDSFSALFATHNPFGQTQRMQRSLFLRFTGMGHERADESHSTIPS